LYHVDLTMILGTMTTCSTHEEAQTISSQLNASIQTSPNDALSEVRLRPPTNLDVAPAVMVPVRIAFIQKLTMLTQTERGRW